MDKDKSKPVPPHALDQDQQDYPQNMRLIRLAESLGLNPETVARLRHNLLPEGKPSSPLRIQNEFSFRQGAKIEGPILPDMSDLTGRAQGKHTALEDFDEELQEKARKASFSAPAPHTAFSEPAPHSSIAAAHPQNASAPSMSQAPLSKPQPAPAAALPRLDLAMEAELRLRRKIEAEQNWSAFRHEAWKLYESFPRQDMAARLVELAFLYGSAAELEEVLGTLIKDSIEFYCLISADIRLHLVIKLWQSNRKTVLDGLLFRKNLALKLVPLERLYCCWSFIQAEQGDKAYKFFRRHDQEIWNAQKLYGAQIKHQESELAFVLGRLAMEANDEGLAMQLLESIPQQAPEFQRALDMLLDLRVERDGQGLCSFGQKLQRDLDWRGRIGLLDSFLLRMQRYETSLPKDRAALNELLKDPLKWFPESAEAWQSVAEVLLQYHQLEYLLPNILHLFRERANQFSKPGFDHALWSEVRKHDFGEPVRNWFWHAVAMLHEFTWNQGKNEELLWEARRQYFEASEHVGKDASRELPMSWHQLHRSLLHWIHKTTRIDEVQRQKLMVVVKLLGEARDINESDICSYLGHVEQPSRDVMDALERLAREREQWGLEGFILDRKAQALHYTNTDLNRLWMIGAQLKRHDQCWRVATILRSRLVLNEQLDRHWTICGEKKREFNVLALQESHVKKILGSFEGYERRLAEALLLVGPVIPELLAILNQHLVPIKKGRGLTETEAEIHGVIEKMSWLTQPRKMYSSGPSGLWHSKPPFFSSLLDTKWSLVFMALAQRLGITAWDWQLSLLHHQIETIIPRMARGVEVPMQGKVGRWLRSLSPLQRKAWYELGQLSRRFDDEQAQVILARLLAKLSTTMLQDHSLALSSLEKMRAPLRVRWDLEHWIVSEVYGELRRSLGSGAVGQYPQDVFEVPALTIATSPVGLARAQENP